MQEHAVIYFGTALAALAATPLVTWAGRSMRILDRPGARRVHASPVPRVGGVAVFAAMLAVIVPLLCLDQALDGIFAGARGQVIALLAASTFVLLVGLADDTFGMKARTKLLAQIAAAIAVCALGIRIEFIIVPGWRTLQFGWWAWPITVFWIVAITNAVNLIDGLDGLAAGISAITCGVITVFAFHTGQLMMAGLMLALLGSLTGFLFFNFNPARIFLGDCGSMFLGFFLATASVMCAVKSYALIGLAMPAIALGLPIFDTFFSMIRRVLDRRSVFAPDRAHLHHRLIDMGLNQRKTVIVMYGVTILAAGTGLLLMIARDLTAIVVIGGALIPVVMIFRVVGAVRLRDALSAFQRNRAIAMEARAQQEGFEKMQLQLRQARSPEQWWDVICRTAEEMGFARLAISFENADGTPRQLSWGPSGCGADAGEILNAAVSTRDGQGGTMQVKMGVSIGSSLESAGRRLALFGRLLDEEEVPDLRRLDPSDDQEHAGG